MLLLLFCLPVNFLAQENDSSRYSYISASFNYGIIYAHHEDFKYFIDDYVSGFELNYGFQSKGKKIWQRVYNYPETGLGYSYVNFGNPEVLGTAHAFFTYINLPLIEGRKSLFTAKFAVGVSYLNKPFDLYRNKYNIAIGSNINAYLNINFDYRLYVYRQFRLLFGLGLRHFSNGGTTKPNKGINIFLPSAGISYNLQKRKFVRPQLPIPEFIKNHELSILYTVGYTSSQPASPTKYFVSDISINLERQFSYKGRVGIGVDLFYDASIPEYDNITDSIINYSFAGKTSAGIHVSYDFVYGKTSFTVQFGGYFYKGNSFEEYVYHRFGIKYRFAAHWVANLTLKTFWAKAKYPEFGIGYLFKW
jgi:hypothetical protein